MAKPIRDQQKQIKNRKQRDRRRIEAQKGLPKKSKNNKK